MSAAGGPILGSLATFTSSNYIFFSLSVDLKFFLSGLMEVTLFSKITPSVRAVFNESPISVSCVSFVHLLP